MTGVAIPPPSPRDAEVRDAVLPMIEACAWREASVILRARLDEIARDRETHLDRLFREWDALPRDGRPDFLTWAHHRRNPELAHT